MTKTFIYTGKESHDSETNNKPVLSNLTPQSCSSIDRPSVSPFVHFSSLAYNQIKCYT
jgi:hypothetical protein